MPPSSAGSHAGGCLLCEMEHGPPDAVVFRDQLWAAEVAPGYEVPGWYFLRVRRHAELLTGLSGAELSTLGHRARDLVAAVTAATGAPATYLLHFGENYRHFHALVAARGADIPAGLRGGNILALRPGHVDVPSARTLASAVRKAYEDLIGPKQAHDAGQVPDPGQVQ
jgi:diadenosine tetraphosphate (Ap4A) HIT family hydrolase